MPASTARRPPRRAHAVFLVLAQVALMLTGTVVAVSEAGSDGPCSTTDVSAARSVLMCVEPAMAFIRTATSSGTGLLLPGGHVVTNAHVIDPYGSADITISGRTHEEVPVLGVDLLADVALLGPVEADAKPLALDAGAQPSVGEGVFLVGYTGDTVSDAVPTISTGVVSRFRDLERWDLSYLETDANIGSGQSSGALVGVGGNVIGLSTRRFSDDLALALTATDLEASINRILSGTDDGYTPWPTDESGDDRFQLEFDREIGVARLAIPPAAEARTVELFFVGTAEFVVATGRTGATLGVSQGYITYAEQLEANEGIPVEATLGPTGRATGIVGEDVGSGTFTVDVPANTLILLDVIAHPYAFIGGFHATVVSSVPLGQISPPKPVVIDSTAHVDGIIDTLGWSDLFTVDLREGQTVEIYAGAPAFDILVALRAPSESWDQATIVGDTDEGRYGTDEGIPYTAPETGTYEIEVFTLSPFATSYQLILSPPE